MNSSSFLNSQTFPKVKDRLLYWVRKYLKDLCRLSKTGLGLTPIIQELVGNYKMESFLNRIIIGDLLKEFTQFIPVGYAFVNKSLASLLNAA